MAASKFIISATAGDDLEGRLHGPGGEDAEVRGGAGEDDEAWGRPGWGRPRGRQRMRRGRPVMHARPRTRGRGRGRTRGQGRRRWRGRDDEVRVGAGRCRVGAASGQRGDRGRGRRQRRRERCTSIWRRAKWGKKGPDLCIWGQSGKVSAGWPYQPALTCPRDVRMDRLVPAGNSSRH